jgi:tripartite-type tricarboxylate transporter receptor subunit TctC
MAKTAHAFLAAVLITATLSGGCLAAETYPARVIRLVVPFPPGGGNDALGRIVAGKLSHALGQRVVVDNKGGAGGMVGTTDVIKSTANGYTLLLGHTGSLAMTPHLYSTANYDPRRDLAPVGLIGRIPLVMVVHTQAPVKTMKQFIDLARIAPGKLNYGSGGSGSGSHLVAELFAFTSGTKLTHVPYKGTAQTVTNLLAREVDVVFSVVPPVRGHIEAGSLRALAITSPERSPALPGVPTVAEESLAGFEAVLNYGLVGPAGIPADIIKRLNGQLNTLLRSDDVKNLLFTDGVTPLPGSSEQHKAVIASDYEKWGEVIRRSGVRVD